MNEIFLFLNPLIPNKENQYNIDEPYHPPIITVFLYYLHIYRVVLTYIQQELYDTKLHNNIY
jgi:hypothetical protein